MSMNERTVETTCKYLLRGIFHLLFVVSMFTGARGGNSCGFI